MNRRLLCARIEGEFGTEIQWHENFVGVRGAISGIGRHAFGGKGCTVVVSFENVESDTAQRVIAALGDVLEVDCAVFDHNAADREVLPSC